MNSDAAKEILSAYRSKDRDEADPAFREAFSQMESDAELKKWFEKQLNLDATIRQKLDAIEPPPDLQAKILAKIRGEKLRRPTFALPPAWLAVAACLVLGGLALFFSTRPGGPDRFQQFKTDALAMVSRLPGPDLDLETRSLAETQSFLNEHNAPSPSYEELPSRLKWMETEGCRAFVWKDYPASLTCFRLPDGHLLHLVVINKAAMDNANIPVGMKEMGNWHVMFQQKNGMLLMWASQAPMEQLKQVLVAFRRVQGLVGLNPEGMI